MKFPQVEWTLLLPPSFTPAPGQAEMANYEKLNIYFLVSQIIQVKNNGFFVCFELHWKPCLFY